MSAVTENSIFQTNVGANVDSGCFTGTAQTNFIEFSGDGINKLTNVIVQDIQASVSTPVQTFYEIGSRNVHRVAGRPQGQGNLNNVVGPCDETLAVLAQLCNFCTPADLNIVLSDTCHNTSAKLVFTDCICTGITITANAANDVINGSWQILFIDLNKEGF